MASPRFLQIRQPDASAADQPSSGLGAQSAPLRRLGLHCLALPWSSENITPSPKLETSLADEGHTSANALTACLNEAAFQGKIREDFLFAEVPQQRCYTQQHPSMATFWLSKVKALAR